MKKKFYFTKILAGKKGVLLDYTFIALNAKIGKLEKKPSNELHTSYKTRWISLKSMILNSDWFRKLVLTWGKSTELSPTQK